MEAIDVFKMVLAFTAGLFIASYVNPWNMGSSYSPVLNTNYSLNYEFSGDVVAGASGDWLWMYNQVMQHLGNLAIEVQQALQVFGLPKYFTVAIAFMISGLLFIYALKIIRGFI